MKINRHGQAKVFTPEELESLFTIGLTNRRDRTLFAVMLFTACRVKEACTLYSIDIYDRSGNVRPEMVFRKANTKGKLATRSIPVAEDLRKMLADYFEDAGDLHLFPGREIDRSIDTDSVGRILRKACERINVDGVSTHSFRRSALTHLSNSGIPLRIIQEVSGHRNLGQLQKYLEVRPEQVRGAISALSMLSPLVTDLHPKGSAKQIDTESVILRKFRLFFLS
ncbi:MAG: Tyrosine recombinase XerC (plasmid) [Chroococcopsis gigantea SAG 12.99]|jgi:integrase/recombinase XerD|nr:site-specific integrase [Chlorogloea purpurea SAG 13.99]MDV3002785.1 Tyrosine recombinase XerC [Chroococcopsis gigantea SAG 12.99]